jgi:formate-dependent nitrite reductase membrane component NrfD
MNTLSPGNFSAPPDWGWLIVFYFFFGGLAGGCYFLAVMIDLLGRPEDRPLARLGYSIAFPCVVVSGLLLTLDLNRPLRFWHMLIQSNTFRPVVKLWSPMSVGSWALLIFGVFSLISFLGALAEGGRLNAPAWRRVREPGILSGVIAVLGGLVGFFVAGYTGVLLAVTNRPIWSDAPLLGMLFVVSAASISAALMLLLAHRSKWTMPAISALQRIDRGDDLFGTGLSRLAQRLGPVAFCRRHRHRHVNPVGALLAQAVARRSQRDHGGGVGHSRRFHSSSGHRPFGATSVI